MIVRRRLAIGSAIPIRCDHPGSPLSLHLSVPEPDIEGDIKLVIDENTFALSMARSVESLPLSTRAVVVPHGLIDEKRVRPHDLDSGFSSPVTLQSNFIGELTNEHRKSRGSMCGPIPRRRTPLAAYSEEHRCLLITQLSADCPTRRGKRRAGTCHRHRRPERCGKYFRAVSGATRTLVGSECCVATGDSGCEAYTKGNARHQSMLRTLCRAQHVTRDGRMRIIGVFDDAFGPEVGAV